MIVEAYRAISAQKQVIIHCNKLKTKIKKCAAGAKETKDHSNPSRNAI